MKMLRIILFLIMSLIMFTGCEKEEQEQLTLTWSKTFGGSDHNDWFNSVQQTTDGGYILAGCTYSFGAGKCDGWLIKTDKDGNEEWTKTFGSSDDDRFYSVQQTTDGGYILGGKRWLVKTDKNGNIEWSKTFDNSVKFVQQTTDGGYILAGGDLIKTDAEGNKQGSKTFDADFVQQTTDGGYIILDGKRWLVKTDKNGNKEWSKTFGNYSVESVRQTTDGDYILAGYTLGNLGRADGVLIKTDKNGNKYWKKTFEGLLDMHDEIYSVQQTFDEGYILAGATGGRLSSEGSSVDDIKFKLLSEDGWLIKTDGNGTKQWSRTFGGSDHNDWFNSVQQTTDGGYILAGRTSSFGAGGWDGWLIKTDEHGNVR